MLKCLVRATREKVGDALLVEPLARKQDVTAFG
jgi:hypothetical protein